MIYLFKTLIKYCLSAHLCYFTVKRLARKYENKGENPQAFKRAGRFLRYFKIPAKKE